MRFDSRAQSLGLTRSQWRVLAQLRRREGINQTALAELLEIEPITLVRHIDRLVAKGLVERRADPNDRRAWRLYLKEEVQPVLDSLRQLSELTRNEALAGIPADQREQFIDTLLIIKENLAALEVLDAPLAERPKRTRKSGRSKVHGA